MNSPEPVFEVSDLNVQHLEIFDKNIKWNQMKGFPASGQFVGPEAVFKNVFDEFKQNWIDRKATISRYIDSGDGVFVGGFYEGTYKSTGKYMKADFACEYRVKNGKITEFNQYTDTFLIGMAMGLRKKADQPDFFIPVIFGQHYASGFCKLPLTGRTLHLWAD